MKDDSHTAQSPGAAKMRCALWMDALEAFIFGYLQNGVGL
jgi:hypothetical protein